MIAAAVVWWAPGTPGQPHQTTTQEPAAADTAAATAWCEAFPAAYPQVRVESATLYLPDGSELVGYYTRRTGSWRWERAD